MFINYSHEMQKTSPTANYESTSKAPIRADPDQPDSINEIIVKIEMKKFQNLINNRLKRKNNLMNADIQRIFPMNKIADGTARVAEAPTSFKDGIGKSHPMLFNRYEKSNQVRTSMDT